MAIFFAATVNRHGGGCSSSFTVMLTWHWGATPLHVRAARPAQSGGDHCFCSAKLQQNNTNDLDF